MTLVWFSLGWSSLFWCYSPPRFTVSLLATYSLCSISSIFSILVLMLQPPCILVSLNDKVQKHAMELPACVLRVLGLFFMFLKLNWWIQMSKYTYIHYMSILINTVCDVWNEYKLLKKKTCASYILFVH